ncbi:MAG TPA: GNAT family N-acetyltransferase [Bryobacteraceae bacterium]|nr:GNAT family N-acetyltransferase [Bryobacteraceae bacterium]
MKQSIDGASGCIVRPVEPEDALGIIRVLNPIVCAGCYTVLDRTFTEEEEREFIARFPKRGIFHVAVAPDGTVVGFQNVEPFASYTRAFDHVGVIGTYVSLEQRRRGIASQLFRATIDAALIKGYEKLFAFVRADNEAALATYRGYGFDVIGTARRQAKLNGIYVDEVMIEKLLV